MLARITQAETSLIVLAALLVCSGTHLRAQELTAGELAAEEPALDEYRVELVVFEYPRLAGTNEDWRPRPEPAPDVAEEVVDDGEPAASMTEPVIEEVQAFRYVPLADADMTLGDVVRRLRASGTYQPLLHVAWQQPGFDRETARPLDLERIGRLPSRLSGDARLYRSRFLHLALDLRLEGDRTEALTAEGYGGDSLAALEPTVYRLRESRKMRSGELHYFDHPRLGALAIVTPVEPAAAGVNEATGGR